MLAKTIKLLLTGYPNKVNNPQFQLNQYIGERVYPDIKPQNAEMPCVVYTIDKSIPKQVKGQRGIAVESNFTIEIISKSYGEIIQIATLIKSLLHRYSNIFNSVDSTNFGHGTPILSSIPVTTEYEFGMYSPPSIGNLQFVGGLQIFALHFTNMVDSYDTKLFNFSSSLNFEIQYVDNPSTWGADLFLDFTNLNLMASMVSGASPIKKYLQGAILGDSQRSCVNVLYSPSATTTDNENITPTTLNGIYEQYVWGTQGPGTTPQVTLDSEIGFNYIHFDEDQYLESFLYNDKKNRTYKKLTFFTVFSLPNSLTNDTKGSAIFYRKDSESDASGGFYFWVIGSPDFDAYTLKGGFQLLQQDDSTPPVESERGVGTWVITVWPEYGINPNVDPEKPIYVALSMERDPSDSTESRGEYEIIFSSDLDGGYGDKNNYYSWDDNCNAPNIFKEYLFNFSCLHSDASSVDTNGNGTINMNNEMNLYSLLMWPQKLTFGDAKYMEIKKYLIEKYGYITS